MSKRKAVVTVMTVLVAAVALAFIAGCIVWTPVFTYRCLAWGTSDIRDCEKFPSREVNNAPPVFFFKKDLKEDIIASLFKTAEYTYRGKKRQVNDLDEFLKSTGTTAFIVVKDDAILYEKYFNGYARNSINTSFSMAKSFTSALVGIAIDEGYIKSVDEPITNYLPELQGKGFEPITIKRLLTMSSGLKYVEGNTPWSDDALTYYYPDLRKLALAGVPVEEPPAKHFHYNNYHPLYLGMILERATHKPVAEYLQEKIWEPLGMEYPASWSIDSKASGFEKMESGINARAIDFAKFGRLFLNKGRWDGKQVISEAWVAESTQRDAVPVNKDYYTVHDMELFFKSAKSYYKYLWWGYTRDGQDYDFFAAGHLGQYIYVCPQKNLVLVRNGKETGQIDMWPEVLFSMVSAM